MEKTYEGFLNIFKHRDIKRVCNKYNIKNYTINNDGTKNFNVNGFAYDNIPKTLDDGTDIEKLYRAEIDYFWRK